MELGPDGSLVYRCGFSCGLFFGTRVERGSHEFAAHKDKLTCNICGKSHKRASALYTCQRIHRHGPTPKGSFMCIKCGKFGFIFSRWCFQFYAKKIIWFQASLFQPVRIWKIMKNLTADVYLFTSAIYVEIISHPNTRYIATWWITPEWKKSHAIYAEYN